MGNNIIKVVLQRLAFEIGEKGLPRPVLGSDGIGEVFEKWSDVLVCHVNLNLS